MISIIIPVYNSERGILRCLKSIVNNNTDCNYEIIVVNDGSTDKSLEILEEFSERHKNIRIFNQKNSGVSEARNLGIKMSNGEWIMFVDSDDFLSEGWANIIKKFLTKDNDFLIFSKDYCNETDRKSILEKITGLSKGQHMSCVWSKIYKAEIIRNNNIKFKTGIINGEDLLFNLEYYLKCKKIKFCKGSIYNYYINSQSATNSFNKRFIESDILYHKNLKKILSKLDCDFEYVLDLNILNSWLVFFNRYSYVKKYKYSDINDFVNNEKYRNKIKNYRKYNKYFPREKVLLLNFLYKKKYKFVYQLFKIKNKIKIKNKNIIERI